MTRPRPLDDILAVLGLYDSSGSEYTTPCPRKFDMGILQLGVLLPPSTSSPQRRVLQVLWTVTEKFEEVKLKVSPPTPYFLMPCVLPVIDLADPPVRSSEFQAGEGLTAW